MTTHDSKIPQFPSDEPTRPSTNPLISPEALAPRLGEPNLLIVDCRFDLADPNKGERDYETAHIPGAVYAHLDRDLSDLSQQGVLGRHPLPTGAILSAAFSRWNLTPEMHVVAYDDANGALAAARLWWLLRLTGHMRVSVLDGGLAAWHRANSPLEIGAEPKRDADIRVTIDRSQVVWTDELECRLADKSVTLVDARAAPRYRGDVEPIDKKAGHIPGALNRPFSDNLDTSGRFKPRELLRDEFSALIDSRAPRDVVHSCGSGVTACHNALAMEAAGLAGSRVYAPSWSGWISEPAP